MIKTIGILLLIACLFYLQFFLWVVWYNYILLHNGSGELGHYGMCGGEYGRTSNMWADRKPCKKVKGDINIIFLNVPDEWTPSPFITFNVDLVAFLFKIVIHCAVAIIACHPLMFIINLVYIVRNDKC